MLHPLVTPRFTRCPENHSEAPNKFTKKVSDFLPSYAAVQKLIMLIFISISFCFHPVWSLSFSYPKTSKLETYVSSSEPRCRMPWTKLLNTNMVSGLPSIPITTAMSMFHFHMEIGFLVILLPCLWVLLKCIEIEQEFTSWQDLVGCMFIENWHRGQSRKVKYKNLHQSTEAYKAISQSVFIRFISVDSILCFLLPPLIKSGIVMDSCQHANDLEDSMTKIMLSGSFVPGLICP